MQKIKSKIAAENAIWTQRQNLFPKLFRAESLTMIHLDDLDWQHVIGAHSTCIISLLIKDRITGIAGALCKLNGAQDRGTHGTLGYHRTHVQ